MKNKHERNDKIPNAAEEERWGIPKGNILYLIRECFRSDSLKEDENAYIIYIDKDYDIDWDIRDNNESDSYFVDVKNERFIESISKLSEFECIPIKQQSEEVKLQFKRMLGEGLYLAFNAKYDEALLMFEKAKEYIISRNEEQSREWQLKACFCGLRIMITIITIILFAFCIIDSLNPNDVKIEDLKNIGMVIPFWVHSVLAVMMGGIGSIFFVIIKLGNLKVSSESFRALHRLEVLARITIGGISGFLMLIMLSSGIIFSSIVNSIGIFSSMLLFCFVAGYSEKLIPNMLKSKIEKEDKNGSN